MKSCKRCSWEIIEIHFSEEQKLELWYQKQEDLLPFAVKFMTRNMNLSIKEAKGVYYHINKKFGNCIRCNNVSLKTEDIECEKCQAFNYNWNIEPAFNSDFCASLEYSLTFDSIDMDEVKGFWCDGISHIPRIVKQLTKEHIKKHSEIMTSAWIGNDGQGEYDFLIKLGPQSKARYLRNESLVDCIPGKGAEGWIHIHPDQKYIEVELR